MRYLYWPEAFSWLSGPLMMWSLVVFLLTDAMYGICFARIKREENMVQEKRKSANGNKGGW